MSFEHVQTKDDVVRLVLQHSEGRRKKVSTNLNLPKVNHSNDFLPSNTKRIPSKSPVHKTHYVTTFCTSNGGIEQARN